MLTYFFYSMFVYDFILAMIEYSYLPKEKKNCIFERIKMIFLSPLIENKIICDIIIIIIIIIIFYKYCVFLEYILSYIYIYI